MWSQSRALLSASHLAALLACAACAPRDPALQAPDDGPDEAPDQALLDGPPDAGTAFLVTAAGPELVAWQAAGGRALVEGDIDIGDATLIGARARATTVSRVGALWSGGVIPYEIDRSLAGDRRVTDAIAHWNDHTALQLRPAGAGDADRVRFAAGTDNCSSPIGRQGGTQTILLASGCTTGAVIHEIGHSVGLWHEQTRPDRDDFVTVHTECIEATREGNFARQTTEAFALGAYDLQSIMHYGSDYFSIDPVNCPTLTTRDGGWITPQRTELSPGDLAAVQLLYTGLGERSSLAEAFGTSLATGDFNGDGRLDLAVGAPLELTGDTASGAVLIYLGTRDAPARLLPWQVLTQSNLQVDEAGDRFGAALAVGDLDDDGVADLAVGAPGEDLGAAVDSGAVFLFRGAERGLVAWRQVDQVGLGANEAGDAFGTALAAGDVDRDGDDDLAIGAPGETPGSATTTASGYVFLLRGGAGGQAAWGGLDLGAARRAGDRLGQTLAVGDVNGDGYADVVAGAPWRDTGATRDTGAVVVFPGASVGPGAGYQVPISAGTTLDADAHLGQSLALGDVDRDGRLEVAAGAPERHDIGAVYTFRHSATTGRLAPSRYLTQAGVWTDEVGDRFGSAVAYGKIDGDVWPDLVIGASGEAPGVKPAGGALFVFRGGAGATLNGWASLDQASLGVDETGDQLGARLTIGDLDADGRADIVAGLPGEAPGGDAEDAGAVMIWRTSTTTVPVPWLALTQES